MSRALAATLTALVLFAGCNPKVVDRSPEGASGQPMTLANPAPTARPQPTRTPVPIGSGNTFKKYWCIVGDGSSCTDEEWADPVRYKQVLILPAGFEGTDYGLFQKEFQRAVDNVTGIPDTVYVSQYKSRILFIGYWYPSDPLGTPFAAFNAQVYPHPIRGKALGLDNSKVESLVDLLQSSLPVPLKPWAVMVLFNTTESGITATTATPGSLGRPYGISKIARADLDDDYVPEHELAHASLNFVDEYVEGGLEETNITSADAATPLLLLDGSWGGWVSAIQDLFGTFSIKASELLAGAGFDNVDVTEFPSRVATDGYTPNEYEYEGGMFFGRGTWHDRGDNIMNSDHVMRAYDDGFGYDHSDSQKTVIHQAFEDPATALRPNDRIRNAGPLGTWSVSMGSTTHVLLYDGDKNHHYHPTQRYDVEIGWYDREWKTCWDGVVPYPCYDNVWQSVQKSVTPELRGIDLKMSAAYGITGLLLDTLCKLGITELHNGASTVELCGLTLDQLATVILPTVHFISPYQDVVVPTDQWMTDYYWRFRTFNGTWTSGWTGWTKFTRSL